MIKRYSKKYKTFGSSMTAYFMKEWWSVDKNKEKMRRIGKRLYREGKMGLWRPGKGILHPMIGRYHTEATKDKISQAHMGMKFSKQHKKNLSKAIRRRWQRGDFKNWDWAKIRAEGGIHLKVVN